jgi:hypothetical protein
MKKLVVAAVLISLLAGAIYAQELRFDGYLNAGIGLLSAENAAGDYEHRVRMVGVDSEQNGFRFRLNGSYTNEAKNAGVRFRFQSQARFDTVNTGYLSLPYVYGWVSFFDNKLSFTGGIVDDSTFQTGDWWINDDVGEGLGLLVKLTPIEGLNFGAGAYILSQQSGSSNNILQVNFGAGNTLPNFGNVDLRLYQIKYTLGVSYVMKDTFRFGVAFRTKNQAGWDNADTYAGRQESSQLFAEFRLLAVKDLTAVVAASFDVLEDFADAGNIVISETFGYKLNNFNVGLNAVQFIYNRPASVDPGFLFNLWGSYTIDKVVPRVDVVFAVNGIGTPNTWHRKAFTLNTTHSGNDRILLSFRPSVRINLDNRTHFEIGDMLNIDLTGSSAINTGITNAFYLDFRWTF